MTRETWASARYDFAHRLLSAEPTYVGEWQSQKDVSGANTTYEILGAHFTMPMPEGAVDAAVTTGANLPWAEDHFQERVSGIPMNPPPSNAWWPFNVEGNALHKAEEIFSHTYPERYWPKFAGMFREPVNVGDWAHVSHSGIRFGYGDLDDVVNLLKRSPYSRQAYLPVWHPEDTGSVSGQRVPCTLGYQFLIRETVAGKKLHIFYTMRSCDFIRHLPDDIYMTIRLAQWVRDKLDEGEGNLTLGTLHFNAGSLHIFEPDRHALSGIVRDMTREYNYRLAAYASGNGVSAE